MSGRHPFQELSREFTAERRQRIDAIKRELLAEMPLHELRRARTLTQQDLADTLQVSQPAVAKLEQRADVYVSSLRSYIEAVGGKLRIIAEFPEGEVAITNFSQLEGDEAPTVTRSGGSVEATHRDQSEAGATWPVRSSRYIDASRTTGS